MRTIFAMVFTMSCRRNSAPVPGVAPPLLLHWLWSLQSCCSHTFSLHYPSCSFTVFPLSFHYSRGAASVTDGVSLASCRSQAELAPSNLGSASGIRLLPKPCHTTPIQYVYLLFRDEEKKSCVSVVLFLNCCCM